jgi:hypothetical protein
MMRIIGRSWLGRGLVRAAAIGAVALAMGAAEAAVLDDFEVGPFDLVVAPHTEQVLEQSGLPTGNVLAANRKVTVLNENSLDAHAFLEDTPADDAITVAASALERDTHGVSLEILYRFDSPVDLRSDGSNAFELVSDDPFPFSFEVSVDGESPFDAQIELPDGRDVVPFGLIEALADSAVNLSNVTELAVSAAPLDEVATLSDLRSIRINPYTARVQTDARVAQDADLDGVFESLLPEGSDFSADRGIWGAGERRIGMEFDLQGLPSSVVEARLIFQATGVRSSSHVGASDLQVHGFVGDGTVQPADVAVDNPLTGVNVAWDVDVTSFLNERLTAGDRFAGFSIRELLDDAGVSDSGGRWALVMELPPAEPEIEVNPTAVDFVDTDLGSTDMQMVTITNTGDAPLMLASVALAPAGDPAFALSLAPAPGTAVAPAASEDVEVTFTPTDGDLAAGTLVIASDDADEPSVSIPLTGHGVPYDEQAMDLLDFFDGADLQSTKGNRDHAMRNLLESAGDFIDRGQTTQACEALAHALQRVDGIEPPDPPPVPDFVAGPDAGALADEIRELRQNLGCDAPKSPRGGRCGIGVELALLLPPLFALRRRRASRP